MIIRYDQVPRFPKKTVSQDCSSDWSDTSYTSSWSYRAQGAAGDFSSLWSWAKWRKSRGVARFLPDVLPFFAWFYQTLPGFCPGVSGKTPSNMLGKNYALLEIWWCVCGLSELRNINTASHGVIFIASWCQLALIHWSFFLMFYYPRCDQT